MREQPYPVAPDGKLHYCDPPFEAHSFILANGSTVPVAVSDGYSSWQIGASDTAGAGMPSGARSLQVQSAGVGTGPVTLYAREELEPGNKLAQPVAGSISAAITNAISATVSGTVGATTPAGNSGQVQVAGNNTTVDYALPADSSGIDMYFQGQTGGTTSLMRISLIMPDLTIEDLVPDNVTLADVATGLFYSVEHPLAGGTKVRFFNAGPAVGCVALFAVVY